MLRRWLICALFSLPFLLSLAGWAGSYQRIVVISYQNASWWGCFSLRGTLYFAHTVAAIPFSGFRAAWGPVPAFGIFVGETPSARRCVGFVCDSVPGGESIGVPFWSLAFFIGLLWLLAWRKTAHKKPSGAFPVEIHQAK